MSSTAEKILAILNELEPTANAEKRSAQEVAKILLGESPAGTNAEQVPGTVSGQSKGERQQKALIDSFPMEVARNAANNAWQLHYYRDIYSCRPGIGKLIVFAKRVVRKVLKFLIEPITEEQTRFNSATVNTLNAMRNNDVVLEAYILQLQNALQQSQSALEQTRQMLAEQGAALSQLQEKLRGEQIYENLDYFDFENHFRGNRADIKEAQKSYLSYFEGCSRVLDLGSGRGEFLELLQENGISATGVDHYGPFVEFCASRGLNVVRQDAVEYLKSVDDESLDGIAALQLIEHMSTDAMVALCRESYRVLQPGKVLILETPNPTCLSTYMNSFYLDPSHNKPVHPKTVEYFLKKAGFRNIRVVFTEESKSGYRLPLLDVEGANLAEFNDGVNMMSDIVFGSQDYAIIAEK